MIIWHGTADTPIVRRPRAGLPVIVRVGSSPVEAGQSVRVCYRVGYTPGTIVEGSVPAVWVENHGINSYWRAELGPFRRGDLVEYWIEGSSKDGDVRAPGGSFQTAPRLWLALLWHQHQPLYRDLGRSDPRGSFLRPWVRLHAIRDYYSMAALVAEQPSVRVTFNLTPVLLRQLADYAGGATDEALELTLKPAEELGLTERERLLGSFFDADWHNQIFVHPRYRELFAKRMASEPFSPQELRDLQMWFNLAWFGKEFREGDVPLVTGETVSVRRFVERQRDFSVADIQEMVTEQLKVLRAVVPIHKALQDAGNIEVSTTPFYHPILPLLVDTDRATIDRPGTRLPPRFAHPDDAGAQVEHAVELYRSLFGRKPRGMWPAEGAVAQFLIPIFAQHGIRWIATDQGVLARSGRWGYRTDVPDVLCRAYQAEESTDTLAVFFRATGPSDDIGFHLQSEPDPNMAVRGFLERAKAVYGSGPDGDDRLLTVAIDGENAWGAYHDDGRPFLRAFYRGLAEDPEIETTTFAEHLERRAGAGIAERKVYDLFTGSWIDEWGSGSGVDLGTWIGEPEENRGWELLGAARDALTLASAAPTRGESMSAIYAAEGSDWFWWFGSDQDSGTDQEFDDLFRLHLKNALRAAGVEPPPELETHIVPRAVVWMFSQQVAVIQPSDRLVVRTNCPGTLEWWYNETHGREPLVPVGGVMAGVHRHERSLGPFEPSLGEIRFRFECQHVDCRGNDLCCWGRTYRVRVL